MFWIAKVPYNNSEVYDVGDRRLTLLRGLQITIRNQVWSIDISYMPMENGFMYLYAIIDVYSRYIVGWGLYNTLDASNAIEALDKAVAQYGAPEIINSDQGVQYTCEDWHRACD